jgi:hypothetical protein
MHWEALSALASLASTGIVLGAAITALRHMRLANQINAFDEIMAWQQSTEARGTPISREWPDRS